MTETGNKAGMPTADRPLVSVLLTSYNYERYVGEAIASVYAQTYRPIELIIADDGSQDQSRRVIEESIEYAPIAVKTIFKDNGGQASALNAAYEACSGSLIFPLDCDDLWRPDKLARMTALIKACPDGGVYQHQICNQHGLPSQPFLVSGDLLSKWRSFRPFNTFVYRDWLNVFMPTSALGFRRSVLEKVMPIPDEFVVCPDAWLAFCASVFGPLYSHPMPLGTWREHDANASGSDANNFQRFWRPVIMPKLNAYFARHDAGVRLTWNPAGALTAPLQLYATVLRRKLGSR